MLDFIFGKQLSNELYKTKKIKVCGVRFTIKKVNLLNYLDGSEVLVQKFDIHKTAAAKAAKDSNPISEAKMKKHYSQLLVAGVVEPKLSFTKDENGILVDDLFINQDMVSKLYLEILEFTYGKKKVKAIISATKDLSNSTV